METTEQRQRWLDKEEYQRRSHDEAYKALGITAPDTPKVENMRINTALGSR